VTPVIRAAARRDILDQIEWYASQGVPDVARRFREAAWTAINHLAAMPDAGFPRPVQNPRLTGLRRWPVQGFNEVWVYYLIRNDNVTVIRILHDKRDTERLLSNR